MALKNEYVNLSVSDGTSMKAYVVHPAQKPKAAMLVFQEIFGVNEHIRDITGRFAEQGYLSISPDLFHRTVPGFETGYTDMSGIEQLKTLTDASLEADIRASFDWLQKAGGSSMPVGSVGYCMGGRVAFLAAITLPLACGISYYGGGIAPSPYMAGLTDRAKDLKAPVLMFWGGLDQHIGPEQVNAVVTSLRDAKKPYVSVEFSDADHGFFCDARASYNAAAAAQAWPLTLSFLKTHGAAAN